MRFKVAKCKIREEVTKSIIKLDITIKDMMPIKHLSNNNIYLRG